MAHEILVDAGLTDIDAEFEQLAVNTRRSPKRIFATQSADQFSYVFRNSRPPRSTAAHLPGPEQTKALTVPSDHGVRFDDDQSRPPAAPDRAPPCPQESIGRRQFRALHRALENDKLVPECKVLQLSAGRDLKVADTAAVNAWSVLSVERRT